MEIQMISRYKFKQMQPLITSSEIFNTEAELYLFNQKNNWQTEQIVLKRLYNILGTAFSNKLFTVSELIDKKDEIGMEELVMPTALAEVGKEIIGFTMPYVPNINFQEVLNSKAFTHEQKVAYLKEIGAILEKMKRVRTYTGVKDFYLNDIHENNFILNTETGRINVVDLDSAKIGQNMASAARYLTPFSEIYNFPKYVHVDSPVGGVLEVNENTDIYCYIIMIFKYFFGDNIGRLSVEEFYTYLTYLKDIGVSTEFIDVISCIYTSRSNENPYELLDCLTPFYGRTHKNTFNLVRRRY